MPTLRDAIKDAPAHDSQNPDETVPLSLPYSNPRITNIHLDRPQVIVGPVIGVVTDTTARILLETNRDARLTVSAVARVNGIRHTVRRKKWFTACLPSVIVMTKLKPGSRYTVFVNLPTPGIITSSFKTRPNIDNNGIGDCIEAAPLRLAFVAGNTSLSRSQAEKSLRRMRLVGDTLNPDVLTRALDQVSQREKAQRLGRELWKDLYQRVYKDELDVLIHLGNTPYSCVTGVATGAEESYSVLETRLSSVLDAFDRALYEVKGTAGKAGSFHAACEIFRNMFRAAWNGPYVKHVLANVSNYMTMNETEIGLWTYPRETGDAERFVAACAYEVYNEYVRNLWVDYLPGAFDFATVPLAIHKTHVLGADVALMFLDLKACKAIQIGTYSQQPEGNEQLVDKILPHLGIVQWNDVLKDLEPGGRLDTVKCLIVSTQQRISDTRSMWHEREFKAETYHLLRRLFDWRNRKPLGHREVLLVSSDSEKHPATGVADIVIDSHNYEVPSYQRNRIRELSLTGMGKIHCVKDVPNLGRPSPYVPVPTTKKLMRGREHEVKEDTDYATHKKSEGDIIQRVQDLRDPCKKAEGPSIKRLGEEFIAVQYKSVDINCYATAVVSAKYVPPVPSGVGNAKLDPWTLYIVRPSVTTQVIGAEFDVKRQPPAAGIMRFAPVESLDGQPDQCRKT